MKLASLLSSDVARLWLYSENELHALPANVKGPQAHPVNLFWNIREWKVE
jgi:hypothetical protein